MKPLIRICYHYTQGLANDANIIKECLSNYTVLLYTYSEVDYVKNVKKYLEKVEINIFLEHIYEELIKFGNKTYFIPNLEWLNQYDITNMKYVDNVLCKTQNCYETMKNMFPKKKINYIKFTSIDRKKSKIKINFEKVFHLKGISNYKNTQLLLNLWMKHEEWPMLTIVHYGTLEIEIPIKVKKNITMIQKKIKEEQLEELMNENGIHICCSYAEGFGHYINEGRSVGAIVLTTNGSPMNELSKNVVSVKETKQVMCSSGYIIDEKCLEEGINKILKMKKEKMEKIGETNRKNYVEQKEFFKKRLNDIISYELSS
tara:strand:+ start:6818 stop:7762 length:945 start_codon:yes stop_codon:yes gene_type:complete